MVDKKKILMLSDHPLSTSGVGTQARYLINGLVATGKYSFRVIGGAVRHDDYSIITVNPDFVIKPMDGFGDKNMLRKLLAQEKPDALLLFTDPRFFIWVWEMEDEVHTVCPIAYNHLWDNPPWPEFNRVLYEATDLINCINYPTYEMVSKRFPEKTNYIPHAVPAELFFPMKADDIARCKAQILGRDKTDHFVVTYVSRNARRKMPNDIIVSFSQFLEQLESKHGHKRSTMIMHTDPMDPEGPNLHHVIDMLHLRNNVVFSRDRIGFADMNVLYNVSDTVVNRSCFAAGTKVTTKDGYKNIEDVKVGDEVLTHMRRFRPVVQTIVNPPPGKAFRLRAVGMDPIVVTGNHKVMAIKKASLPKGYLINENLKDFCERANGTPISDLVTGDYVVRYGLERQETQEIVYDMFEYAKSGGLTHFISIDGERLRSTHNMRNDYDHGKRFVTLDEDLAYVLGEFVGDGCTNAATVSFNKKDVEKIETYAAVLERTFGLKRLIRERTRHIDVTTHNSPVIASFFKHMCGEYSCGKHIPEDVMNASREVKRAFLKGYVAADGCYMKDKLSRTSPLRRCRTVSNRLAMQLRDLLIDLGVVPRVHLTDNSHGYNKNGKIWTIEWNDVKDNGHAFNASCRSWTHDGVTVSRISSLEEIEFHDPVYNLTVEEDHTYVVENVTVFNCNEGFGLGTLEAMMAAKPIIAIKTGGLTRQVEDHETGEQYGIALDPEVKTLVGNQLVPYIYEDFISHETLTNAFMKMYEFGPEKRAELGKRALAHARKDYNLDSLINDWDKSLTNMFNTWQDKRKRWMKVDL